MMGLVFGKSTIKRILEVIIIAIMTIIYIEIGTRRVINDISFMTYIIFVQLLLDIRPQLEYGSKDVYYITASKEILFIKYTEYILNSVLLLIGFIIFLNGFNMIDAFIRLLLPLRILLPAVLYNKHKYNLYLCNSNNIYYLNKECIQYIDINSLTIRKSNKILIVLVNRLASNVYEVSDETLICINLFLSDKF